MYALINIMETLTIRKRKSVNNWNKHYISPGAVGTVGDVIQNVRLKQSAPELETRWEFNRPQLEKRGSAISDGTVASNYTDNFLTNTVVTDYYTSPYQRDVVGVSYQDLRLNDLSPTTRQLGAPQFGWRATQASVNKALVMGKQFLPATRGYPKSGVSRGPEPRSTFLADIASLPQNPVGPIGNLQPTQLNPVPKIDPLSGNPILPPSGEQCGTKESGPIQTPTTETVNGGFTNNVQTYLEDLALSGPRIGSGNFGLGGLLGLGSRR